MNSLESVFFWLSALLLAVTFATSASALVFGRPAWLRRGNWIFHAAFVTLTVFVVQRWIRSGHPPFVSLFESMVAAVWFLLLITVLLRWRGPRTQLPVLTASMVALLLMGWSSSLSSEVSPLSAALQNVWLFIHASFATAGAASFLTAAGFAGLHLLGERRMEGLRNGEGIGLDHKNLPRLQNSFLILGLVLWGAMIASGSIWAHIAWGRYWAWDPIEVWSLISWLLYGLVVHARMNFRLSPRVFSVLIILAALTVVFSLWGVQYVYETIHTYG